MSTPGNKQSFLERAKQSVNDVYLQMRCCDGIWSCFAASWFLPFITFLAAALFAASGWQCTSAPCEAQQNADRQGMQILAVIFALLAWFFSIICTCLTWTSSHIIQNARFERRNELRLCIARILLLLPLIPFLAVPTFGCCIDITRIGHICIAGVFVLICAWFIALCWCLIREYRRMILESRSHINTATPLVA